ncbi:MAG: M48 family metallopeptidase [Sedimentisphaerales bacterium]|nr:M48 family metallopeptidase [Sedimentisphaerales bacterium]
MANYLRNIKKRTAVVVWFTLLMITAVSCRQVPITGRRQLSLVPNSVVFDMSFQEYQDFMASSKVSTDYDARAMVQRIGQRISSAVEDYASENDFSLEGYEWEFNLVKDDAVNAWCMPGGKVVVYTGILPVTRDESGLAVVMSHEIAHAVAEHGNERMSQMLVAQMGAMSLSVALRQHPAATQELFMQAYGVGAQVGVLLPYSRLHESEADHMGLIFMAMAGYDPRVAPEFWQRMSDMRTSAEPPQILSTHPSDATRIQNLNDYLPEAMEYYHGEAGSPDPL